jgi:hypothetical protein
MESKSDQTAPVWEHLKICKSTSYFSRSFQTLTYPFENKQRHFKDNLLTRRQLKQTFSSLFILVQQYPSFLLFPVNAAGP